MHDHTTMGIESFYIQHVLKICLPIQHLQPAMFLVTGNSKVIQHKLLLQCAMDLLTKASRVKWHKLPIHSCPLYQ